jgi:hypothetical protein
MRRESEGSRGGQGGGAEDSSGRTCALHLRRAVCCARLRQRLAFRCKGRCGYGQGVPVVQETHCARDRKADGGGALVGTAPLHTDRLLRRGQWRNVVEVVDGSAAARDTHPALMSRGSRDRIHDRRRRCGCVRPGGAICEATRGAAAGRVARGAAAIQCARTARRRRRAGGHASSSPCPEHGGASRGAGGRGSRRGGGGEGAS